MNENAIDNEKASETDADIPLLREAAEQTQIQLWN